MPPPVIILLEPTDFATEGIAVMSAAGIPARSASFCIVDTQRVQVPHVEVYIAADTPFLFISSAMADPRFLLMATFVPIPQKAKYSLCSFANLPFFSRDRRASKGTTLSGSSSTQVESNPP